MHRTLVLGLMMSLLAAGSALADGVILNGVSPRSLSRGGTNIGFADNGGIIYDNPAAMTNVEGQGLLDVGATMLITDFHYSDPQNSMRSVDFCPLPQMAYIRKSEDQIWAYGVGIFTPAGFSERYTLNGPFPVGGPQRYESFAALMKVLPSVACQVTERLSIGGTFGVGITYASLKGPYFLQDAGPLTGTPTLLNAHGTGATPVWSVASQYLLTDTTTVGATYTSVSNMNLDGNTFVTVPGLGTSHYDSTLEMVWPQSVGAGVRQELGGGRVFSTDVIWYDWSSAFDQFQMTLQNPSNPAFPPVVERLPLRWRDSVSTRIGYEQQIVPGQTFRCGYVHHRIAAPDATLTPFIQATLEHAVSVGYGFQYSGWNIDAGYMYLWGSTRHVTNSALIGGDFDNSSHRAQVHAMAVNFIRPF
jgi:long-chain fatty acid transport protein